MSEITHAGMAVVAEDTGRVLMIQRTLDPTDPPDVQGTWEFPGGRIEEGETPEVAAWREFCEETGLPKPPGRMTGDWLSPNGIYQGHVWATPEEAAAFPGGINPDAEIAVMENPDDPGRRTPDVQAWFTLEQIQGLGPALRPEVNDTPWDLFSPGAMAASGYSETAHQEAAMTDTVTELSDVLDEPADIENPELGLPWHGVWTVEGVWSGDKRRFAEESLTWLDPAEAPLHLTWQKEQQPGHDGSVNVAKATRLARVGNEIRAAGTVLQTPEADEWVLLQAEFGRLGVSVDADSAEAEIELADDGTPTGGVTFTQGRIRSAASCNIPAFSEAWTSLGEPPEGFWGEEEVAQVEAAVERPEIEEMKKKRRAKCTAVAQLHFAGQTFEEIASSLGMESEFAAAEAFAEFKRGPGWITNPEDTKRLHDYWTKPGQPGYAKINWGVPGDFNRCRALVGEKIAANSPTKVRFLNQICAQWHHDALGFWPGKAPTERASVEAIAASVEDRAMAPALSLVAALEAELLEAEKFSNPVFVPGDPRLVAQRDGTMGCPLTIDGDRVFGHLALWKTCHVGFGQSSCVAPPRSADNYAWFLTGAVATTAGLVPVGNITMDTGHANLRLRARPAVAHYDNTGLVAADIAVGDDDFGIWFSGVLRDPEDKKTRRALLASAGLSGDWREVKPGQYELIAALAVNSGGFPVPRIGFSNGHQVSLVGAGALDTGRVVAIANGVIEFNAADLDAAVSAALQRNEVLASLRTRTFLED